MTRIIAALIIALFISTNAMATPNQSFMRDLTIETMLKYAQELYKRGDLQEARNVMARIKQLSPDYMKKTKRGEKKSKQVASSCCMEPVVAKTKPVEYVAVAADPNDDLKQAIAKEEKILRELNRDVDDLRVQIRATHHE